MSADFVGLSLVLLFLIFSLVFWCSVFIRYGIMGMLIRFEVDFSGFAILVIPVLATLSIIRAKDIG